MSIEVAVIDATQSDLDYCREHSIDKSCQKYQFKLTGKAFTAILDDKIIAIGGAVVYWKGVAEGWLIITENANNRKALMALCIKTLTDRLIKELDLVRLQACVSCDFGKAIELVEVLGFIREGKMVKYMPDQTDAWLYSKVI